MFSRAFTLIELLIVVAIIGILAAVAVPNFLNARFRAKIARVEADMKAVSTALEQYFLDWNSYVEDQDNDQGPYGLRRLTSPVSYIPVLPEDPFPSRLGFQSIENPTFEFGSGNAGQPAKSWPATAYLIISSGPNLYEEVDGNDSFPWGVYIASFDVTNGLNSDGDIVRMGGLWSQGAIFVDGKQITSRGRIF
ncbi:MAG: prepilin-type N-terminal cleavage/methylation domain-containing protein [bacterium]